jgi:hypothetical protein
VLVAAVSDFEPDSFIEKAQNGRDDEVIVLGGMMIRSDQ